MSAGLETLLPFVEMAVHSVASSMGGGLGAVFTQPAGRVFAYASVCLGNQADELLRALRLASIPMEMFAGQRSAHDDLMRWYKQWHGLPDKQGLRGMFTDFEWQEIQKIEAEMARDNPWYADPVRLDKVHAQAGTMAIGKRRASAEVSITEPEGLAALRALGAPV